jgi:hypothetical protein
MFHVKHFCPIGGDFLTKFDAKRQPPRDSLHPPRQPLSLALAGIKDPGPLAERDIEPFLAQGRTEFDRQFV